MRTAILATLLLAPVASAQVVGVTIAIDQPVLQPGESTTITLLASFSAEDWALAGARLDLLFDGLPGDPRDAFTEFGLLRPFAAPGTPERLDEQGIKEILPGQLNFPPAMIYADPTNPIAFFEATFTAPLDAGGGYRVDLLTETSRFDVYIERELSTSESRMDVLVEGSAAIHVVPAPASTSAIVLALGLLAPRRRA
jgi:hypothetical protein